MGFIARNCAARFDIFLVEGRSGTFVRALADFLTKPFCSRPKNKKQFKNFREKNFIFLATNFEFELRERSEFSIHLVAFLNRGSFEIVA